MPNKDMIPIEVIILTDTDASFSFCLLFLS